MRRWMGFLLALAMVWMIGCGTVSAGAEETIRREISYPGENYTFAIPAGYTSRLVSSLSKRTPSRLE